MALTYWSIINYVYVYMYVRTCTYVCTYVCCVYVTGSGKSLHLRTKSEINFIAQDNSYTKDLSIHSVPTVQC